MSAKKWPEIRHKATQAERDVVRAGVAEALREMPLHRLREGAQANAETDRRNVTNGSGPRIADEAQD